MTAKASETKSEMSRVPFRALVADEHPVPEGSPAYLTFGRATRGGVLLDAIDRALSDHRRLAEGMLEDPDGMRRRSLARVVRLGKQFDDEFYKTWGGVSLTSLAQVQQPWWPCPRYAEYLNHLDALDESARCLRRIFEEQMSERRKLGRRELARLVKIAFLFDRYYYRVPR